MKYFFKNEIVDYIFINNKHDDTILFLHGWGGNKSSFAETINLTKNRFNILSITVPTIQPTISVWDMFDYATLVENIMLANSIENPIVVCHSFGFRIAMLLNKKIKIKKIVTTGGAGLKKYIKISKININNNKILLKNHKFNYLFKKIASKDYLFLSPINKKTFKNIINLNINFATRFNCPVLLFWGTKDKDTPIWIAKKLKKHNTAHLIITKSDHFAYLKENTRFNHEIIKFLKNA